MFHSSPCSGCCSCSPPRRPQPHRDKLAFRCEVVGGEDRGRARKFTVGHGTVRSDDMDASFDLGPAAFDLGPLPPFPTRAGAWVFSRNDGDRPWVMAQAPVLNHFEPRSAKGGAAHLDSFRCTRCPGSTQIPNCRSRQGPAARDGGQHRSPHAGGVPGRRTERCPALRTVVRFRVRAYPKSGAVTSSIPAARSTRRGIRRLGRRRGDPAGLPQGVLPLADFQVTRDLDHNGGQRHFRLQATDAHPCSCASRFAAFMLDSSSS